MADAIPEAWTQTGWYTPEQAAPAVGAPVTPAQGADPTMPSAAPVAVPEAWAKTNWYAPETATPAAPAPADAPTTLGTGKYLLGRAVDSFLNSGDAMARAAQLEGGQLDDYERDKGQNSAAVANKQLFGSPELGAPAGPVQRYAGDLVSSVASNPVMAAAMPAATVGSSLGGTAGSDLNAATGGILPDWLARLAGGIIGGGTGAYAYLKGRAALQPPAGTPNLLPGSMTNATVNKAIAQSGKLSNTPLGAYQGAAGDTASSLGGEATPTQIGANLLTKADKWIADRKAAAEKTFGDIENQFPEGTRADTPATAAFLSMPGEGPPLPAMARQLRAQLDRSGGTLPYAALKDWRTSLGKALSGPPDANTYRLGQLRDAITADMKAALQKQGGQAAVDAFDTANSGYAQDQNFIRNAIGGLSDEGLSPEGAYSALAANPAQTTTRLRALQAAGVLSRDDVDTIARNQFTRMATDANGRYDPSTFMRNLVQLQQKSPEAVDFLFRNTPERAQAFDEHVQLAAGQHASRIPQPMSTDRLEALKRIAKASAAGAVGKRIPIIGGDENGGIAAVLATLGDGAPTKGDPLLMLPRQPLAQQLLAMPSGQAAAQSLLTPFLVPPTTQQR